MEAPASDAFDPARALMHRPAVARAVARALLDATAIPRALRALLAFERGARVPDDVRAVPAGVGDVAVAVVPLRRAVQLAREREAPDVADLLAQPWASFATADDVVGLFLPRAGGPRPIHMGGFWPAVAEVTGGERP